MRDNGPILVPLDGSELAEGAAPVVTSEEAPADVSSEPVASSEAPMASSEPVSSAEVSSSAP